MNPKLSEWLGALTGLSGAGLLATNSDYSGFGFVLFLVSNFFWLLFGLQIKARGLVMMQVGFTMTSIAGIWRWLL